MIWGIILGMIWRMILGNDFGEWFGESFWGIIWGMIWGMVLGDGLVSFGGPLPRSLLLTLLVSCWTRFSLRHHSQQMVPAKPGATVASDAGPPVSAIRETAFASFSKGESPFLKSEKLTISYK